MAYPPDQVIAKLRILLRHAEEDQEAVEKAAKLTAEALDDVRRSVGALRTDVTRPPLPEALRNAWGHLARDQHDVWGLAVLRLRETGNDEMLSYALQERSH